MKTSRLIGAMHAIVFAAISISSHATLTPVLNGQAIYDSDADLTWLADANAAGTTMDWATANAWAAGLNINGITGWRLPSSLNSDGSGPCGGPYYCTGSEMGNLFYNVLGGVAGTSIATTHNSNYDLFSNVQSNLYWSSTEYAPFTGDAWVFNFNLGNQGIITKSHNSYAWAVHSGYVGSHLACVGIDTGSFDSPMDQPVTLNKRATVLPFNMMLIDNDGNSLTNAEIAPPMIQVVVAADSTDSAPPPEALESVGKGDDGNQFTFNGTKWGFNLKTTNFTGPGKYTVTVVSGNLSAYVVSPTCEGTFYITR